MATILVAFWHNNNNRTLNRTVLAMSTGRLIDRNTHYCIYRERQAIIFTCGNSKWKIFARSSNWILRYFVANEFRCNEWAQEMAAGTSICTPDEKRNTIYQRHRANFGAEYALDCTCWICNAFSNLYLFRKEFYSTAALGRFAQ